MINPYCFKSAFFTYWFYDIIKQLICIFSYITIFITNRLNNKAFFLIRIIFICHYVNTSFYFIYIILNITICLHLPTQSHFTFSKICLLKKLTHLDFIPIFRTITKISHFYSFAIQRCLRIYNITLSQNFRTLSKYN